MAAPVFTPLPTPPDRESSAETFSTDADAFLGALPTFQTEGNTLGTYCETQATNAAASAAVISSTITVYTSQATFDAATPSAGDLFVLVTP
tara:strand:- start:556 stop:828 length:273 start_codon:yes stop_codon:yes gene_type:complete